MENKQTAMQLVDFSNPNADKIKSASTAKPMQNKQYTRDEVLMLMCKAFNEGFKKYDIVDAGLEGLNADVECAWILTKYDKTKDGK